MLNVDVGSRDGYRYRIYPAFQGGFQVFDHSPVPSHDAGPQISLDNRPDGFLLITAHCRYSCFDLMYSQGIQELGYPHLLIVGEDNTRCLFAIPQGSIYDLHRRLVAWIHEL